MSFTQIAIYGTGGFGRETLWLAQTASAGYHAYEVVCWVDDDPQLAGHVLKGLPIESLEASRARFPDAKMIVAVGSPTVRERLVQRAAQAGYDFATIVHPRVERSEWVEIGEGTIICAGSTLTTDIRLGRQVQINLHCTIGHDVVADDYVTLAPGVHVSGWVRLERGAYIGTGATIINGTAARPLVIGMGATVGAGACVTKSVPPGITVVGVPARPVMRAAA
jgi:sugar O-acyltransferase (sialic acid O-acetyltransferase NeuD family)